MEQGDWVRRAHDGKFGVVLSVGYGGFFGRDPIATVEYEDGERTTHEQKDKGLTIILHKTPLNPAALVTVERTFYVTVQDEDMNTDDLLRISERIIQQALFVELGRQAGVTSFARMEVDSDGEVTIEAFATPTILQLRGLLATMVEKRIAVTVKPGSTANDLNVETVKNTVEYFAKQGGDVTFRY